MMHVNRNNIHMTLCKEACLKVMQWHVMHGNRILKYRKKKCAPVCPTKVYLKAWISIGSTHLNRRADYSQTTCIDSRRGLDSYWSPDCPCHMDKNLIT